MSIDPIFRPAKITHRYHTHSIHRSSNTLIVEQQQLEQATPHFNDRYRVQASNAALAPASKVRQDTPAYECTEGVDASHELLDYYLNDSISESADGTRTAFDQLDLKFNTLDFSLTRRLLGAVFFLLVIYAWKQYIDDEEESDTIYI